MSEEMLDVILWVMVLGASVLPTLMAVRRIRKLRAEVASAISETSRQHALALQKVGEALVDMQKQQQLLAQQLHIVTTAYQRLRTDVVAELHRRSEEDLDPDADKAKSRSHTLH